MLPGAVPRKQLQIRVSKSLSRGRQSKTAYPGGKSQHEIPITGKNLAAKDRPGSVSSQQTFVLENDIRKPLIIRNVFQLVFFFFTFFTAVYRSFFSFLWPNLSRLVKEILFCLSTFFLSYYVIFLTIICDKKQQLICFFFF